MRKRFPLNPVTKAVKLALAYLQRENERANEMHACGCSACWQGLESMRDA